MSLRQRRGEAVREARRVGLRRVDAGYRVQVRRCGGGWVTVDVCGVDEPRALEAAQARVDDTAESTDAAGETVVLRGFAGVRILRGRETWREWKHGQLLDGGEAEGCQAHTGRAVFDALATAPGIRRASMAIEVHR